MSILVRVYVNGNGLLDGVFFCFNWGIGKGVVIKIDKLFLGKECCMVCLCEFVIVMILVLFWVFVVVVVMVGYWFGEFFN